MLDVDVVPLMDPAHLFAAPAFSASGCLFWPDAWDTWVTPRAYELLGLRRSRVEVRPGCAVPIPLSLALSSAECTPFPLFLTLR